MKDQLVFAVLFAFGLVVCIGVVLAASKYAGAGATPERVFETPRSIAAEHEELHRELAAAMQVPGRTGQAAQRVAAMLHEHFEREEEFAMPPLALLVPLAAGRIGTDMREMIAMSDRLEAELAHMLDEHKAIVVALDALTASAQADGRPEVVRFVEELKLHARMEEEIFYPAAILVGKHLKLQAAR